MSIVAVLPVAERIADALYQRLQLLAAGYSVYSPVRKVVRPTRLESYTPEHMLIVMRMGEQSRLEELDCFGNPPAIAYQQRFDIFAHLSPSEKEPTPIDRYMVTLEADIVKVVCDVANNRWHTFGELAINSEWQPMEPFGGEGGIVGFNKPLLVTYRVSETDPYQVRA